MVTLNEVYKHRQSMSRIDNFDKLESSMRDHNINFINNDDRSFRITDLDNSTQLYESVEEWYGNKISYPSIVLNILNLKDSVCILKI